MNTLIALCLRQTAGTVSVRKALYREKSLLTPRQREIALLLRDRYSVKEIALELFVAESTVKSAKKIIYDILDIHSKAELAKMEF
jgi:LuxR family maltose regulon positive regulatory protein